MSLDTLLGVMVSRALTADVLPCALFPPYISTKEWYQKSGQHVVLGLSEETISGKCQTLTYLKSYKHVGLFGHSSP